MTVGKLASSAVMEKLNVRIRIFLNGILYNDILCEHSYFYNFWYGGRLGVKIYSNLQWIVGCCSHEKATQVFVRLPKRRKPKNETKEFNFIMQGYPNGSIAQVRELLETELPKATRSTKLGIDVDSIREMIDYAEGYQGFACFPERTVRLAVKEAVSNLSQPIHAVMTQLRTSIAKDVRSAVEDCQGSILTQVILLVSSNVCCGRNYQYKRFNKQKFLEYE